ncbi:Inner membrane protein YfdC [Planctomycetes bacterium Pan216]|uniref:Inner membrane protein YfdC n=1 Tax=Kolteria novifilia TaxID=2527975 RepID=A0A518B6X3_9BACT|nr:Inner membrane protein YfdC [Planctomycetes bacterium Pan216]
MSGEADHEILLPDGQPAEDSKPSTERSKERKAEDRSFTPVIVKRIDEIRRHPDDVLERTIHEGVEQLGRPLLSLVLSSVAAGLILGFTVMAVAVVTLAVAGVENDFVRRIATAAAYPLGFIICIVSGTELFTEHTATAVYPVLDRRASLQQLARLWVVVFVGNLLGAFASACLLQAAEGTIHANEGYAILAQQLVSIDTTTMIFSAVLGGWLMAQGAWLIAAVGSGTGQLLAIYIVTFVIGLGHLHHSIAGSAEVFAAVLGRAPIGWEQVVHFIVMAVIGNTIGGSLFVALLNYGHIRTTRESTGR